MGASLPSHPCHRRIDVSTSGWTHDDSCRALPSLERLQVGCARRRSVRPPIENRLDCSDIPGTGCVGDDVHRHHPRPSSGASGLRCTDADTPCGRPRPPRLPAAATRNVVVEEHRPRGPQHGLFLPPSSSSPRSACPEAWPRRSVPPNRSSSPASPSSCSVSTRQCGG